MSVLTAKWTIDEYHRLVRMGVLDHKSVELLRGEIVQMSPEGPLHSNRIRQSANVLRQQIAQGYEVSETHPITLDDSEPEPDLAVIKAGNYDLRHPFAAETRLIIEFASSSLEKDLEEKRLVYARAAIPEYWVVNLRDREVVVFCNPNQGDYQQRQVFSEGIILSQTGLGIFFDIETLIGTT